MKRTLLTAAIAALALGAAQAATTGWTADPNPASSAQQQAISSLTSGLEISLGSFTSFSGSAESATTALFTPSSGNTYTVTNLGFAIWSSGQWDVNGALNIGAIVVQEGSIVAASTATVTQFAGAGQGTNHYYAGTSDKGFISFDFEGFEAAYDGSYTVYFVNTTDTSDITTENLSESLYNVSGVGIVNGAYRATLLPEPTALALLALGVAGVALRRRVD